MKQQVVQKLLVVGVEEWGLCIYDGGSQAEAVEARGMCDAHSGPPVTIS